MRRIDFLVGIMGLGALFAGILPANAAQLTVLLPQGRTSFQTNEVIDVSVVRSDTQALPAGVLTMAVTDANGGKLSFTFPVKPVALSGAAANATENLHLDGWLLKPGDYTVSIACDGATAQTTFSLYSNIRQSTYRLIHWGGPAGPAMVPEGEAGMGFNLIMSGDVLHQEPSIKAGVDVMGNDLMGGGHQFDLKQTNDWSDPNVYIGAIQRGIDRAFTLRTLPNNIGAHLYDEPGLTWLKSPRTGIYGPNDIPSQRAAYLSAFGQPAIWADQVDTTDPAKLAAWEKVNTFKLSFMDAFWKASKEAISRLKPGYLVATQSVYGWSALYDGYYFNVARSLPVISGHGGYDDFWLRNLNPSYFLEMGLPRQLDKPTWYLPEWGITNPDAFCEEHNLSFITGIQGMSTPPTLNITSPAAPGIIKSNKLFARIGTIFTKPEYTPQDVAILYSKSNVFYRMKQIQPGLAAFYTATKLDQYPISVILEEDVLDGTLARKHKAVILTGIAYLDPRVITGLEDFIKSGGTVFVTKDCAVTIAGATPLNIEADAVTDKDMANAKLITDPIKQKAEMARLTSFGYVLEHARPLAKMLKAALLKAGIKPAFESSVDTIAAGRQVRGDIEYLFAVNFTPEPGYGATSGGYGNPIATTATITLPDDGRPVYDAVTGKLLPFRKDGRNISAKLTFAPGQMIAMTRTARPIGGVQVGTPVVSSDFTRTSDPIQLQITASLVDTNQQLLAGTAPLEIKVTDPAGSVRYDLYRSTNHGVLNMCLPLAANDTPGKWTVAVTELLSSTTGTATFNLTQPGQCGAVAGMTRRATFFPDDASNIYSFFRNHRQVTIVAGTSPWDQAAAERVATIFKPYDVTATFMPLADAMKPRPLSDEEAATWCGDQVAGSLVEPQRSNPQLVGYNLPGPTILIGNAADNPLIQFLNTRNVMPYKQTADFPGNGQGMVVWNLMTLGHDIESVALIANDAEGMDQAVGTAFELGVGLDPLTPYILPASSSVVLPTQIYR